MSVTSQDQQSYGLRGRVIRRAKFLVKHEPYLDVIDDGRRAWNAAFPEYRVSDSGAPNFVHPEDALYLPPALHSALLQAGDRIAMLQCVAAGSTWHTMVHSISTEFWPIEDFPRHHLLDMTAGFITACLSYHPRANMANLISRDVLSLRQSWWDPYDLTRAMHHTFVQLNRALDLFDAYVPREVLEDIREEMIFRLGEEELQDAYKPLMSHRHGSFRYVPVSEDFQEKDWQRIREQLNDRASDPDTFLHRRVPELLRRGLSKNEVANQLGIAPSYVPRFESE